MKPNDLSFPIYWGGKRWQSQRTIGKSSSWLGHFIWQAENRAAVEEPLLYKDSGALQNTLIPPKPGHWPRNTTQPQQEMCLSESPVSHREMRAGLDCVTVNRAVVQVSQELFTESPMNNSKFSVCLWAHHWFVDFLWQASMYLASSKTQSLFPN